MGETIFGIFVGLACGLIVLAFTSPLWAGLLIEIVGELRTAWRGTPTPRPGEEER